MQTGKVLSVEDWLRGLGFECYVESFLESGYDNLLACQHLTEEDLNNIGLILKPGHRKTLLAASKLLQQQEFIHSIPSNNNLDANSDNNNSNDNNKNEEEESEDGKTNENKCKKTKTKKRKIATTTTTTKKRESKTGIEKEYKYIPGYRTGGWAILVGMYEGTNVDDFIGYFTKKQIISIASPYCDSLFENVNVDKSENNNNYTAWSSMKTLITHNLINKKHNPSQYSFTDLGKQLAHLLYQHRFNNIQKQTIELPLSNLNEDKENITNYSSIKISNVKTNKITSNNVSNDFKSNDNNEIEIVLILDYREIKKEKQRNIYKQLKNKKVKCEKRVLEIGDFMWIARYKNNEKEREREYIVNYIVERKKIPDLQASIIDGRYKDQKFRLKKSGIQNIIYLIEGKVNEKNNNDDYTSNNNNNYDSVETAMYNTQIQDNFIIQNTNNEEETVQYLYNLTNVIIDISKSDVQKIITKQEYEEFNSNMSKSKNLSVRDIFAKQMIQFSGCTPEKASSVVSVYKTPISLITEVKILGLQSVTEKLKNIECGEKRRKLNGPLSRSISEFYSV